MHPASVEYHRSSLFSRVLWVLWSFPAVCFTLALVTDIAYWRTMHLIWAEASSWLLLAGMIVGVIAAVAWVIGAIMHVIPRSWRLAVFGTAVLLLGFFNSLIHAGDGWTAIMPWGLLVSALTAFLLVAGFFTHAHPSPHHSARRTHT